MFIFPFVLLNLLSLCVKSGFGQQHPTRACSIQIIVDKFLFDEFLSETSTDNKDEKERIARYNLISLAGRLVNQANKMLDRQFIGKVKYKLVLKNIKILKTEEECGSLCEEFNNLDSLLNNFSYTSRDGYCLSYLLTYRNFENGQLGLAYTAGPYHGGVCETFRMQKENYYGYEEEKMKSLNTGVITLKRSSRRVSEKVAAVTFAHEIGHSFGSSHDPQECQGNQEDGTYLMYESGSLGTKKNNMVLSPCSVNEMSQNLNSLDLREGGSCWFLDSGRGTCGNSIVEVWEECDCGDDPAECERQCCVGADDPDGRPPCKLVNGAQCSPSEGLCCDSTCQILPAESICQAETECSKSAKCTGVSAYCPVSEAVPDSTPCDGGGRTCVAGQCSGSICPSIGQLPCVSTNSADSSSDCKPYCHSPNSQCTSLPSNYSYLDGTECTVNSVYGYCVSGACALYSGADEPRWLVGVVLFLVFYSIFLALSVWIYCRYCRNTGKVLLPVKTGSSITSNHANSDS